MAGRNRYVARKPRHQAARELGVSVVIERVTPSLYERTEVELVDLSREGVQFRSSQPLSVGETITLRIHDVPSGLRLDRRGAVKWEKPLQQGRWSIGCQFFEPVDWETLGELFLNDVLSTDPAPSEAASPVAAAAHPPVAEACGDASPVSSDA
jgi:hypothetical protein